MHRTIAAVAGTLAAALVCALWWASAEPALAASHPTATPGTAPGSPAACYAFAVGALRRHEVVHRRPVACIGLGTDQVNQAVDRAIHTVLGPLPKAAERRKAEADSRYLASLIRTGRPPRPAPLAPGATATPDARTARLAALAVWLATALAGAYLLAGRLRRRGRWSVRTLGVAGGHAGLALAGLCLWIAFMATSAPALGWTDVAVSWIIVGLGMATLLSDAPAARPAATRAGLAARASVAVADAPVRAPVVTIALHGFLAATTIVLVLTAVVGG